MHTPHLTACFVVRWNIKGRHSLVTLLNHHSSLFYPYHLNPTTTSHNLIITPYHQNEVPHIFHPRPPHHNNNRHPSGETLQPSHKQRLQHLPQRSLREHANRRPAEQQRRPRLRSHSVDVLPEQQNAALRGTERRTVGDGPCAESECEGSGRGERESDDGE